MAFLRLKRRRKGNETYEYWTVVESFRTARGPRQRTLAVLGKAPGLDAEERVGWEDIAAQLSGRAPRPAAGRAGGLFDPPGLEAPEWAEVDLGRVRVERGRRFGDVYLALALWRRLRLDEFFGERMKQGREEIAWSALACLHAVARFCQPGRDWAAAEAFLPSTALGDLLGVPVEKIHANRMYRALDAILPRRAALFSHLKTMYGAWFAPKFDIFLYDVASTFFEGQAMKNAKAARGYSRDSRPDCKQVCIGLVTSPEQLPLAFMIFAGNRPDIKTVEDVRDLMVRAYGPARRLWIVDRGMVSEDQLALHRQHGDFYIVATPRSMLKRCEKALLEEGWEEAEAGVEIKEVALEAGADGKGPPWPGVQERFVLCRSRQRIEKDRAIVEKASAGLEKALAALKARIDSGRERSLFKAGQRLGRLRQKYSRASAVVATSRSRKSPIPKKPAKKTAAQ